MKVSKKLAITVATVVAMGGLMLNQAGAGQRRSEGSIRERVAERIKAKLGLTEEQIGKIKAEIGPEKANIRELVVRLHEARVGLRQAIEASDASEASVHAAAEKLGAAQAELAVERVKLYARIKPILTEAQQQKVRKLRAKIDEFMESAAGRHHKKDQ